MRYFVPKSMRKETITTREVPSPYHRYKIPFAKCLFTQGPFGSFLCQQSDWDGCSIQLNHFFIDKKVCFYPYALKSLIMLHFMLEGHVLCRLKGFGRLALHENLCCLFYVPGRVRHSAWFNKGQYRTFQLHLSRRFLKRLSVKYGELKEVDKSARLHSSAGLQEHAAHISFRTKRIIDEMLACTEEGPDRTAFLESRVWELLRLYVKDQPAAAIQLMPGQVKKLFGIRDYILNNLDQQLTIPLLAKKFIMSDFTLKKQFKTQFGKPVHRYILEHRMERARALLLEMELPVSTIAFMVGFTDPSYFDKAFKKYFNRLPTDFRKNSLGPSSADKR